jgi:TorA maturation chaperone TorD
MDFTPATPQTALFLRFYARCFMYPYEEMGYELQHLFRQLERGGFSEDEYSHLDQILNIINSYQGEEIKTLRENYVMLFSQWEGGKSLCPLIATDFCHRFNINYDSASFVDDLLDSGIPVNPEEPLDSIINYLEHFSLLCDLTQTALSSDELVFYINTHLYSWIPFFCDLLYRAGQISFYKELSLGLKSFLLQFSSNQ